MTQAAGFGFMFIENPMQYDNGKDNSARLAAMVIAFRLAIYDQLKTACNGSAYIPTTASLRNAAFQAIAEIVDGEVEEIPPRLLLNVWNAVMLTNESAFHQKMAASIEAGTLTGITIVKGKKAVAGSYY